MAGWLETVRSRKAKGAGEVKLDFAGQSVTVKLAYPDGGSRVKVGELIDDFRSRESKGDSVKDRFEFSDKLELLVVKECLADAGDASDEELTVLIRETGGTDSPLVQRSAKLIGVEAVLGGDDDDDKGKTAKKR